MHKKIYQLSQIMDTKPGLKEKSSEILEIIEEAIRETQEIIIDILININYVSCCTFQESIRKIGNHIENEWNISPPNTFFVSSNSKEGTDSSQEVLNLLKSYSWKDSRWRREQFLTRYEDASKKLSNNKIYTVIIVDDFIGTSDTVMRAFLWFQNLKTRLNFDNLTLNIKIVSVAVCEDGKNKIQGAIQNSFFFVHLVSKSMNSLYKDAVYEKNVLAIKEFSEKIGVSSKLALGYGECEACYYRYGGNTPNNVFGMFWSRHKISPIMHRT